VTWSARLKSGKRVVVIGETSGIGVAVALLAGGAVML
jgi:hypothetical protein